MEIQERREVEERGPLSREDHGKLLSFFGTYGRGQGLLKRYLIDYTTLIEGVAERKRDIRLRLTNGVAEIIVKTGAWAGGHRREVSVKLWEGEFENAIWLMAALGYKKGVGCERVIRRFLYDDVEFSLQEVPDHSFFYEAEIVVWREDEAERAHAQILRVIEALGLEMFSPTQWYAYVERLNDEANSIFDCDSFDLIDILSKGGSERPDTAK